MRLNTRPTREASRQTRWQRRSLSKYSTSHPNLHSCKKTCIDGSHPNSQTCERGCKCNLQQSLQPHGKACSTTRNSFQVCLPCKLVCISLKAHREERYVSQESGGLYYGHCLLCST